MNKKKLATSAVALGMAGVMLLGGTFAWQSISQTAENETANIVNPGGRLHDDFDGKNKDIYVENFGEEPIFARVRLEEYFALVINQGKEYAKTETKLGTETKNDNGSYTYTGDIYVFQDDNRAEDGTFYAGYDKDTEEYRWSWTVGGEDSAAAWYMPTFNKNKDSLVADVNGWFKNGIGTFGTETSQAVADVITARGSTQYEGYTTWKNNDSMEGSAIYDIDRNSADELATLSAADLSTLITEGTGDYDTKAVKLVEESHDAKKIGDTRGLVSMEEWLELLGEDSYSNYDHGGYWVYDTDGWVYWSSPIQPGTATGRLLDGIQLNGVMNDSWYYAINVVAQFVTPDDLGKADNTGFYDTTAGKVPSESAEKLLNAMTAGTTVTLGLDGDDIPTITVDQGTPITLALEGNANWESEYGTSYLDVDNFTIGTLSGGEFTKDETRAAANSARERYTAGTYGTLDLNYAENTVTLTLNMSAKITIADPDGERAWQGNIDVYIDWSQLVTMRNISSAEYDTLVSVTNGEDDKMHWSGNLSITSTASDSLGWNYIIRGGYKGANYSDDMDWEIIWKDSGLRPAFALTDKSKFENLTAGTIVVIGTLYVGDEPVRVPTILKWDDENCDVTRYDDYENRDEDQGEHCTLVRKDAITLRTALEDEAYQMKAIYVGDGLFICDRVMLIRIAPKQILNYLS